MDSDSSLTDVPSELSSPGSLSPSFRYPSPNSSQDQDDVSSLKKRKLETDQQNPAGKKRKRPEPKPRTTVRLDFTNNTESCLSEQKAQLDLLLKVLRKRRKIVVVAGAGISVSAGIPDFRSSNGLFKTLKSDHKLKASGKQLFDASVYQNDKSTGAFHDMVRNLSGLVSNATATPFHQMLSTLGQEGRLLRLYTQNVDGIDVALPALETSVPLNQKGPWPRSVQLHGGLEKMVCSKCHALSDFQPDLFDGPVPPACPTCIEADKIRTDHAGKRSHGVGRLRPRMVLYNEHNPDEEAIGACMASDLRSRPDAIIVVGTSMKIPGVRRIVKEMCGVVRGRRDGIAVWINHDEPPPGLYFEDCWDLIVKGSCDEVARQWNAPPDAHKECSVSDVERAKDGTTVSVVLQSPSKAQSLDMLTPAPSPISKPSQKLKLHLNTNAATNSLLSGKPKSKPRAKSTATKGERKSKPAASSGPRVKPVKKKKPAGDAAANTLPITAAANFRVSKPNRPSQQKPSKPVLEPLSVLQPMQPKVSPHEMAKPHLPSPKQLFPNLRHTSSSGNGASDSPKLENVKPEPFDASLDNDLSFNTTFDSIPISDGNSSEDDFRTPDRVPPRTPDGSVPRSPTAAERLGTVSPPSVPRGMEALMD